MRLPPGTGEIYPLASQAKAVALVAMANRTFNFLVSCFFRQLTMSIGKAGTFWLHAGRSGPAPASARASFSTPRTTS